MDERTQSSASDWLVGDTHADHVIAAARVRHNVVVSEMAERGILETSLTFPTSVDAGHPSAGTYETGSMAGVQGHFYAAEVFIG